MGNVNVVMYCTFLAQRKILTIFGLKNFAFIKIEPNFSIYVIDF